MRSKFIITICVLSIIAATIVLSTGLNPKSKGGNDSLTVFDVNSNQIDITYKDESITLLGTERQDFVKCIKRIYNNSVDSTMDSDAYDIIIDFNNGYTVNVSTSNQLLFFDGEKKSLLDTDFC